MSVKSTCLWTTLSVPVTLASTHRSERHARRVLGGRGLLRGGSLPGRVLSRRRTLRGTRPQAASSSSRDPAVLLPQPPVCSLMRPGALFPLLPCTFKLKSFLILNLGIVARIVQRAAMHPPPPVPCCYRLLAVGRCHAEIRSLVHAATSGFCSHVPFAVLQFHPGPHVVVLAPASPAFWDQLSDFAHVLGTWGCVQ